MGSSVIQCLDCGKWNWKNAVKCISCGSTNLTPSIDKVYKAILGKEIKNG
jgi:ribosomal protein L40E